MNNLKWAHTNTPTPSIIWQKLSDIERLCLIRQALDTWRPTSSAVLGIAAAKPDGQVIARFLEPVAAAERGTLLLDLEIFLKNTVDEGLMVWLEPLGDRNSMRNLRGIEVKA